MCFRMCYNESTDIRDKFKCLAIAVVSLVAHTTLVCFTTAVLILTKDSNTLSSLKELNSLRHAVHILFGQFDPTTIRLVFGIILIMAFLGVCAAITLIIGLRCNKPGYVVVYLSFGVQATILLLLGVLFSFIKFHWYFAMVLLTCTVASVYSLLKVNRTYDTMSQEAFVQETHTPSSSDLRLLIED